MVELNLEGRGGSESLESMYCNMDEVQRGSQTASDYLQADSAFLFFALCCLLLNT